MQRGTSGHADPGRRRVPVLEARPGSAPARFARALGSPHPVVIFVAALLLGVLAVATASVLLGLLVVHVLLSLGLDSPDNSVVATLASHRTQGLTDLSKLASEAGGGTVLPLLVGAVALGCALLRRWRVAAFAIFVLLAESASYRLTTMLIHRNRPSVPRLESLPGNASYPSGHTAASVAVYLGLALLLTSRFANRALRVLVWALAAGMVLLVALSRMYRGMHHPLDLAGGAAVGAGAVCVLVFACRAAGSSILAR